MHTMTSGASEPLVTVIIPAYNAERTLDRAISSVLAEKSVPLELIVVDDGSTDSTPQIVDVFAARDRRVKRISRPNGHVAAACNTGLHAARGKFVAFLEADDEWLLNKLRLQLEVFEANSDIGAAFTNFHNHDEVTNTTELVSDQQREVMCDLPKKPITAHAVVIDADLRPYLVRSNFILRSSIMIPRELLLSLGGQDETLRGDDDWDLWFRMGGKVKFAYLAQPLAVRHKGPNSMSRPSPNWYAAVIRSRRKALEHVVNSGNLGGLVDPLRRQICRLHRSQILSQIKRWQWWRACQTLVAGLNYGFDGPSFLLVALGVFGPIPFHLRRLVMDRLRFVRRLPSLG